MIGTLEQRARQAQQTTEERWLNLALDPIAEDNCGWCDLRFELTRRFTLLGAPCAATCPIPAVLGAICENIPEYKKWFHVPTKDNALAVLKLLQQHREALIQKGIEIITRIEKGEKA